MAAEIPGDSRGNIILNTHHPMKDYEKSVKKIFDNLPDNPATYQMRREIETAVEPAYFLKKLKEAYDFAMNSAANHPGYGPEEKKDKLKEMREAFANIEKHILERQGLSEREREALRINEYTNRMEGKGSATLVEYDPNNPAFDPKNLELKDKGHVHYKTERLGFAGKIFGNTQNVDVKVFQATMADGRKMFNVNYSDNVNPNRSTSTSIEGLVGTAFAGLGPGGVVSITNFSAEKFLHGKGLLFESDYYKQQKHIMVRCIERGLEVDPTQVALLDKKDYDAAKEIYKTRKAQQDEGKEYKKPNVEPTSGAKKIPAKEPEDNKKLSITAIDKSKDTDTNDDTNRRSGMRNSNSG